MLFLLIPQWSARPSLDREIDHLFVEDRKRSRQPHAGRAGMAVRFGAESR